MVLCYFKAMKTHFLIVIALFSIPSFAQEKKKTETIQSPTYSPDKIRSKLTSDVPLKGTAELVTDSELERDFPAGYSEYPKTSTFPPDDTRLYLNAQYSAQLGYQGSTDGSKTGHGAALRVMLFIDSGKLGIYAEAGMGTLNEQVVGNIDAELKFRYRFAIDPKHILWWGLGTDIQGRHSNFSGMDPFFQFKLPTVLFGTMVPVMDSKGENAVCVIHFFAKGSFGVFDNRTQGDLPLDRWARPSVGAEALTACNNNIRFVADYDHIFNFTKAEGTDRAGLQFTYRFTIKDEFQVGPATRLQIERRGAIDGLDPTDPRGMGRTTGYWFIGVDGTY
jgi:hypothetical protein